MASSMKLRSSEHPKRGRYRIMAILTLAIGVLAYSASTLAQNDNKVRAGLRMWHESSCADCHGPFADGNREDEDWPVGANLRITRLDAAGLRLAIGCGRAGSGMPAFDERAYAFRACYGRPLGAAPDNLHPSVRKLSPDEIDAVIAYLQARIIGRGQITRAECLTYYEDQADMCEDYKQ
jgi:mono/diheme cytochrome c family protein